MKILYHKSDTIENYSFFMVVFHPPFFLSVVVLDRCFCLLHVYEKNEAQSSF